MMYSVYCLKNVEKICEYFVRMFGHPPRKNCKAPIEKNGYPELDTSDILEEEFIQIYQSLIGALQWVVSI